MQNFMKDRYGVDDLSLALAGFGVVLAFIGSLFSLQMLSIIALVALVLDLARAFSKNIDARRRENESFRATLAKLPFIGKNMGGASTSAHRASGRAGSAMGDLKRQTRTAKKMWKDRKTKAFLKCPNCGTMLSVPKGKGRLIVTCPKCRAKMETKS